MRFKNAVVWGSFALFFAGILSADRSEARSLDYLYKRYLIQQEKNLEKKMSRLEGPIQANTRPAVDAKTFDQRIDHAYDQSSDPAHPADTRTFKQRYYIDSSDASGPDAPVIFVMCGEGPCSSDDLSRGAILNWSSQLKAHRVALEHRYYGASQPFPTLTADNLKYLTVENAIADMLTFQAYVQSTLGLKGKWITVGGSYSGALSAFMRLQSPGTIAGSLASSAPVEAKANFEEYDLSVANGAGPDCSAAMRNVFAKIEAAVDTAKDHPDQLASIKSMFNSSGVRDEVDFLYVVADMAAAAIQYGFKDMFCGSVLSASDPMQGFATGGIQVFEMLGITPLQDSFQSAESLDTGSNSSFELRQWMYQSCTQFGFYQVAYHDPKVSVRSSRIDLKYHDSVCKRLFGIDKTVNTDGINERYYKPLVSGHVADGGVALGSSDILFTDGSTDPWANLSLTHPNGNDTNPALSYFLIDGAAHCDDLGNRSSDALSQARALFSQLSAKWVQ